MLGILLTTIASFFSEVSLSMGKWSVSHKKENIYTYGFLNYFWVLIIFIIFVIIKNNFLINPSTLFILLLLVFLEIFQVYSSLNALIKAERSTLSFLLILTIPLLLIVDIFLGYNISILSIVGITIIIFSLLLLFTNHGIKKTGISYVLFSAINAVATISIYKYLLTQGNTVEAIQISISVIILIFLYIMSKTIYNENPIKFILKKEYFIPAFSMGLAGMLSGFAYLYAPASIITSAKRASSIIWSILSGNHYFHEKHLIIKILSFVLIVLGLGFMIV